MATATTINRILATLRHVARWIDKQRPFLAGSPFAGVKDITISRPAWNGMLPQQVMALKSACEVRIRACTRSDQNPELEAAVFFGLLHTGLRSFELVTLDVHQYHHKAFHDVVGKGMTVAEKVPVPTEARDAIDRYLTKRGDYKKTDPLLVSRYGSRLSTRDVRKIIQRLCEQACVHMPEDQKFKISPHSTRHTFLKRVADNKGIHIAQRMSRNVGYAEIFRYTQPSTEEVAQIAEEVYG